MIKKALYILLPIALSIVIIGISKIYAEGDTSKPPSIQVESKEYKSISLKYHEHINEIVERKKKACVDEHLKHLSFINNKKAELEQNPEKCDEIIKKSTMYNSNKIMLDGDSSARQFIIASSSKSAKIFTALYADGKVNGWQIVQMLYRDAELLDKSWGYFLQSLIDKKDQRSIKMAAMTLFRANINKEKYRPILIEWAKGGDEAALTTLLFSINKDGLPIVVRTIENIDLVDNLATEKSFFEVQASCANYYAEIGNLSAANILCIDILWRPYKTIRTYGEARRDDDFKRDSLLYGARMKVLSTLFYKVITEKAIKEVYDRSTIVWTTCDHPDLLPDDFKNFTSYSFATLEVQFAQGLIDEVKSYE